MQLTYQIIKKKFNNQHYFNMDIHYIINGVTVVTEEYKNISTVHKRAHEILEQHNPTTVDCITDNDRFTINLPGTNGK